jgi:cytochrome c
VKGGGLVRCDVVAVVGRRRCMAPVIECGWEPRGAVRRTWRGALVVSIGLAAAGHACAQSNVAVLIDDQHCMFCHTTNGANLAPSFPQIADRYRKVAGADVMLAKKLAIQGKAHWGDITMPDADRVQPLSSEQAKLVAQWVLSQ